KNGNAAKVDCSTSALTSAVGSGSTGCSYCYENASQIGSNDGLRDAMLPGSSPTPMSTDNFALTLTNDSNFGVDIVVNYAKPFLEATVRLDELGTTPSCATKGLTTVIATGGGFGPPSGCTVSSCPASGSPATSYFVDFVKSGGSPIVPALGG